MSKKCLFAIMLWFAALAATGAVADAAQVPLDAESRGVPAQGDDSGESDLPRARTISHHTGTTQLRHSDRGAIA